MQKTELILLKIAVAITSWLPFRWLYALSDVLSFLFLHLIRYRHKVVLDNLRRAFPTKTEVEILAVAKKFYRHFSDVLLEGLKGLTLSKTSMQHRFVYSNPEIFEPLFLQNKSAILLGSHYGNWEWGVASFPLAVKHQVVGIYKPLKNRLTNSYLNERRQRWGLHLASMKQAGRAIIKIRNQPCIFVLIADQTPANVRDAVWLQFLNQDTPFLHGPEKLAKQTGYPVFTFDIKRLSRGFYEVSFHQLSSNELEQTGIVEQFAFHLESQIKHEPSNWLWSHRRWKRQRTQP